VVDQE
jgi:hypothetical protein